MAKPLSERKRPFNISGFKGQSHIWGPAKPLFKLVESDSFHSLLFWGPSGVGKTTLAQIIGHRSGAEVCFLTATRAGVKDLRSVVDRSEIHVRHGEPPLLMFLDEIHRLAKNQQDVLLPALESGMLRFIGATTENPSFAVNSAILSRCLVFPFYKHDQKTLVEILSAAGDQVANDFDLSIAERIASAVDGDARQALNIFEAYQTCCGDENSDIDGFLRQVRLGHDKSGDSHYNLASALIKSIRACDADASLYYLARMLEGGEDLGFICRRLIISASEDVGNGNPTALLVATTGSEAVKLVGLPEARIILSQMVTYLAASPKSNRAYEGINKALSEVRSSGSLPIPFHLLNASNAFLEGLGYGAGYKSPHSGEEDYRKYHYLPDSIKEKSFYLPKDVGAEKQLKKNLETLGPIRH